MELLDEKPRKSKLPLVLAVLAVAAAVSLSGYFFNRHRRLQALLANPQEAARVEIDNTVKKVSALVELPADEEPTVATVSDAEKLRDKPFFARAQDGDRVIVFSNARKAILYRPSTNKIIEMSAITMPAETDPNAAAVTAAPQAEEVLPATVAVLNGAGVTGLAATAQRQLAVYPERYRVEQTGNAVSEYGQTVVVDASGTHGQTASVLADLVGGSVSALPDGEAVPLTDLVVILGADYRGE